MGDSIGLLLMALLTMQAGPAQAAEGATAPVRVTQPKCVTAARTDADAPKRKTPACALVPPHQSRLARISVTLPPARVSDAEQLKLSTTAR